MKLLSILPFGTAFYLAVALALAASSQSLAKTGDRNGGLGGAPVAFHYGHLQALLGRNEAILTEGVRITSAQYEMTADSAHVFGAALGGVGRIVAIGDPDRDIRVKVSVRALPQGAAKGSSLTASDVDFVADQAVYLPDASRPQGGSITFTGHVVMTVSNKLQLAGPSVSQMEKAVVLLGPRPDYPQVEASDVNGTATPLTSP